MLCNFAVFDFLIIRNNRCSYNEVLPLLLCRKLKKKVDILKKLVEGERVK